MPTRKDTFSNGCIYHIYNKTIDNRKIFNSDPVSLYFIELLNYYKSSKSNLKYSQFKNLNEDLRMNKEIEISIPKYHNVEILCHCLIPNHFHLLIKQKKEQGIIRFMSNTINSITHFYNLRNDRKGPVFFPQFKSRIILTDEALNHNSRYIHLNPYTCRLVGSLDELLNYRFSSFPAYINEGISNNEIVNPNIILANFNHDKSKYKEFVFGNAEHQKTLEYMKHLEDEKFVDVY